MSMNTQYAGKSIGLVGITKSSVPLVRLLVNRGAKVKISELQTKEQLTELLKDITAIRPDLEMELGKNSASFLLDCQTVILSAGAKPEPRFLEELRAKGIEIVTDIELLCREVDVPIIAVTGSEGKTTTALLLKHLLESQDKRVFFAGDQGEPLAQMLVKGTKVDYLILELSHVNLDPTPKIRTHITVLTSLLGSITDRSISNENYAMLLKSFLKNSDEKSFIIYNFRDAALKSIVAGHPSQKHVFRRKDPITLGDDLAKIYKGSWLASNGRELAWKGAGGATHTFNLRSFNMFGLHNKDNLMGAVNAAKLLGVSNENIQRVIDKIPGVPHRLEFVKKKGGVKLINDSRCTNVDLLRMSLDSFSLDPIILISGGRDAQADFSSLSDIVKLRVKTLILVGEAKEHINRCLGDFSETFLVGTFEEAILLSYQKSREGDIILLAPGCESYDMFISYEERGNYFKKYVEDF